MTGTHGVLWSSNHQEVPHKDTVLASLCTMETLRLSAKGGDDLVVRSPHSLVDHRTDNDPPVRVSSWRDPIDIRLIRRGRSSLA